MSKVVKVCENRDLGHIVRSDDGNYYYVDSNDTIDCGYETMVFEADEDGEVVSWSHLYCKRYSSYEDMEHSHNYIVNHLEEVL